MKTKWFLFLFFLIQIAIAQPDTLLIKTWYATNIAGYDLKSCSYSSGEFSAIQTTLPDGWYCTWTFGLDSVLIQKRWHDPDAANPYAYPFATYSEVSRWWIKDNRLYLRVPYLNSGSKCVEYEMTLSATSLSIKFMGSK